jgi:pyruvate dehydrogenase (quinone)
MPASEADITTSDILVETLIDWGATHVFGIVGDGINSIIESLRKRQDRIRYIAVRHEEAAAFMASGWPSTLVAWAFASAPPVRARSI